MTKRGIWLHDESDGTHLSRESVISALDQSGIRVRETNGESPSGPGVFLFDAITDQTCRLLSHLSRNGSERVFAVATRETALTQDNPWRLLSAGASDVFAWNQFPRPQEFIAARLQRWQEVDETVASELVRENLVGSSPAWTSTLRQVVEMARFSDAPALLLGESGTGKELVARLIHALDPRPQKGDLVVLDCAAIVSDLAASEFFGHERGAFTSALTSRDGAFALADGGTLFLDELGELPMRLQAELLRVIQERSYKRVGGNNWKQTNFRLISATNRDLAEAKTNGHFRRDLYYRLAGWKCRLPPLGERREDLLPLTRHFLRKLGLEGERSNLDPMVKRYLELRDYAGNIRELQHLLTEIAARHVGEGPITLGDLPEEERPLAAATLGRDWKGPGFREAIRLALGQGVALREITRSAADVAIELALEGEDQISRHAAGKLKVHERTVQMHVARRRHRILRPLP